MHVVDGFFPADQIFFVGMTGYTEFVLAGCPKLEALDVSMGIMANRAIPRADRAVDMAFLEPGFLVDVAPETDVLHFPAGDGDFQRGSRARLLMAGEALHIDGRAVLPRIFPQDIFMAGKAEGLCFTADVIRKFDFFRVVTLDTAFRQ